jgi:hypothetical protein
MGRGTGRERVWEGAEYYVANREELEMTEEIT